jgi:uncharacterized membrane protein YeaQ/YmgE (transglycosylase-associated protein family)
MGACRARFPVVALAVRVSERSHSTTMNLFTWILLGLLAGGIAKLIFPGKDPGGCLATVGIGIIGALIGGLLGTTVFGWGTVTGFNLKSLGIAIAGSLVLLSLFRLVSRRV